MSATILPRVTESPPTARGGHRLSIGLILAAWFALCWASWSGGTGTAVDPEGDGEGDGPAASRTAGKDTAGTSRCSGLPPAGEHGPGTGPRPGQGHGKVTGGTGAPH